jgi:hypothetical protein
LYPLQQAWRTAALAKIVCSTLVTQSVLLSLVFALFHGSIASGSLCLSVSSALIFLYSFVIYPRKLRRALLQAQ